MKEIKLFVDFEFTSLSPDAQPISVGIVSLLRTRVEPIGGVYGFESKMIRVESKSFYAEFTDFDISRCDDWVKENVLLKLNYSNQKFEISDLENTTIVGDTANIAANLKQWLSQFSDYKIQFVVDCGRWDWYWMLQLLAKWDVIENEEAFSGKCPTCGQSAVLSYKRGLPKLPTYISPVPMDLNDLIAFKKGISVSEAFDLNREELAAGVHSDVLCAGGVLSEDGIHPKKHNALWDAKVIKAIYEQLNS